MLSFKDGKAMKPIYDYYVETDLDTIDDQPIDYSKRYDDQLADDVCGSSSTKKRHLSTPSQNVVPNKIPGDELKVYCIEGTPLLISSASSLCDLNEIGALFQASEREALKKHPGQKTCFQEQFSDSNEDNSLNKRDESLEDSKFEGDQNESKDFTGQENTSSRTDETFSKASSPLMFSRSSSICSLNSFEQHSIVDDRSSVSMFSNLASGIISPSEIPDSPGEAMSPFIHKKQSEFVFPPSEHQSKSLDPVLAKLKMHPTPPFNDEDNLKVYNNKSRSQPQGEQRSFNDEAFEDNPEDNLKVYNDEGDCCSVSNLSALSIQASSLSHVSVAVFHKSSFPVVEHKSSIRISCSIVTGNAELQSIAEDPDVPKVEPTKDQIKSFSSYVVAGSRLTDNSDDQDCIKSFSNYPATGSRMMDRDEDQDCIKSFNVCSGSESMDDDYDQDCVKSFSNYAAKGSRMMDQDEDHIKSFNCYSEPELMDDDEDQDCVKSFSNYAATGSRMTDQDRVKSFNGYSGSGLMDNNDNQDCVKSFVNYAVTGSRMTNQDEDHVKSFKGFAGSSLMDDDEDQDEKINFSSLAEDEEDCKDGDGSPVGEFSFEDGFEPHLKSFEKATKEDNFLAVNESPDYSKDNSDDDCDAFLEECIKSGMPTNNESLHQPTKQISNNPCLSDQQSRPMEEIQDQNISHSDCDASDSEEENLLLQSCIQLGMPQKSSNNEPNASSDSNSCSKPSNSPTKSPQSFAKEMDITEVSDDEEYDPFLQQVIQMGKPKNEPKESLSKSINTANAYSSGCLHLGYRDNRPDGTSDEEDDDDDILSECIQAGMPKPKIEQSKSPYALPTKSPTQKPQPHSHRQSPASDDRAAYMSSFAGPHQPSRKYPTSQYRASHPKANQQRKSPTKQDRVMPLPSYTKLHHRQPHRRSPTPEDRVVLLSTVGGQQFHYSRKSPARMLLPLTATQHRKSPPTPTRMSSLNSSNQPRRMSSPAAPDRTSPSNSTNQSRQILSLGNNSYQRKYQNWMHDFRDPKIDPAPIPDATCVYRTEDTPILSPSASVSDLSTLSFSDDRMYLDCSLNNSRNSDCSSESEDELLRQCIRSGMPSEKRALA